MQKLDQIFFKTTEEWSDWLANNHNTSTGIMMIFYKKHTGVNCVPRNEALDEALCFGWVDSLLRRINSDRYVVKFTPRKQKSQWSATNKKRVLDLMSQGRMTEFGLNKIEEYRQTGKVEWVFEEKKNFDVIPDYILKKLEKNPPALNNFLNLAPGYKRSYVGWITSAKRKETINKRLAEAVSLLKENKKLWIK